MVVKVRGRRRCSRAWIRSGNWVVATSRIAIWTDSQDRNIMLTNRIKPASVGVKVINPRSQIVNGSPRGEKIALTATTANGRAITERFKVKPNPKFARSLATSRKNQAKAKASQDPSGRRAFDRIKATEDTTFTLGSREWSLLSA